MNHRLILIACLLTGTLPGWAQPEGKPISFGESFSLHSDILGEERPYSIYLPPGYIPQGQAVSVLYLMDGKYHFLHTIGIVQFLMREDLIPDMMVVGIHNTADRTKDLTPTILRDEQLRENRGVTGGADQTLQFIKTELIPEIERRYHTNSYRLLVGHSFGGLFAVHALVKEPDLFDAYLAIGPSLYWDHQYLVEQAESFFDDKPDLMGDMYFSMSTEGRDAIGGAMRLAAILKEKAPRSFRWKYEPMEEEDHGTMVLKSIYNGLESIFKDWDEVPVDQLYTQGGLEAITAAYEQNSARFDRQIPMPEGTLNRLAYRLMEQNRMEEARKVFEVNQHYYPQSYHVYTSMGDYALRIGDSSQAQALFTQALAIHPLHQRAIEQLAQLGKAYDGMAHSQPLPRKRLAAYLGAYRTEGGNTAYIKEREGKLTISAEVGLSEQALIAYPERRFVMEYMNAPLVFEADEEGKIISFTAQMGMGYYVTAYKMP